MTYLNIYLISYFSEISKILVDPLTANLRLFCWLEIKNNEPHFVYFKRSTLDFGDSAASEAVEIGQRKIVVPACKLPESKFLLCQSRYANNYLASFQRKEDVELISNDLIQAHNQYSWPLKDIVTSSKTDPNIFEKLGVNELHM